MDTIGDKTVASKPTIRITRPAYNQNVFDNEFKVIEPKKTNICEKAAEKIRPSCGQGTWKEKLNNVLPITSWLCNYNFKEDLLADIIVGITVAVFQVPQSMGYSLIAHVSPVHGLYTAFFPALIYSFLGTSHHSAVGAFAIVSGVMTGNLVTQVMQQNGLPMPEVGESTSPSSSIPENYSSTLSIHPYEIATAASLWIGIYMLIFGILRFGFITIYLSEHLISGFATAASLYVFTSQLRYLFGVHLPYNSGMFAVIKSYIDLLENYKDINLVTTLVSIICCVVLLFFKVYVNEKVKMAGFKIPIPIELFVVIGGTIASHFLDLKGNYNVAIVGEIKKGLPSPEMPRLDIMLQTWMPSISLATVGYTITLTIGKLYGNKHGYEVRHNQELVALGTTNIVSSFFRCLPAAASLPRSAVQEQAGGRTQLASLVNCGVILIVLFYMAPLLQKLPNCVLASIIAVALKSLLAQAKEFNRYLKVSNLDASIWMVSFLAVLILDVDVGLYFSIVYSLLVLIYKTSRPESYILGPVNETDVYVAADKYESAAEVPGIKIYKFCGPLHFANVDFFKTDILKKTQFNQRNIAFAGLQSETELNRSNSNGHVNTLFNVNDEDIESLAVTFRNLYNHLIIDCSMISYCDASGIQMLRKVIELYQSNNINVYLTSCVSHVMKRLEKDLFLKEFLMNKVYISIHDSVLHIVSEEQQQCENCFDCKVGKLHDCNDIRQKRRNSRSHSFPNKRFNYKTFHLK